MEYGRQICIDSLDFDELLKQNHDGRMFLNMSCVLNFIFGTAVVALGNYAMNRQTTIDHLQQEKRSLMDLVVTLEDELTAIYAEEESEETEEAEDLTKHDEKEDLTKPDELDEIQDEHID